MDYINELPLCSKSNYMKSLELELEDARELQKQYPDTFFLPSKKSLEDLKVGDFVKICYSVHCPIEDEDVSERWWVKITSIRRKDGVLFGKVHNSLLNFHIPLGTLMLVKFHNIYQILKESELEEMERDDEESNIRYIHQSQNQ